MPEQMISSNIDLGQILITLMIGIIGWFIKRELQKITDKLEIHDEQILGLVRSVSMLIGTMNARKNASNRRIEFHDSLEPHD